MPGQMRTSDVKTLDRLTEVLDCFTHERPAWSLAELSAHLDVPKSTLHRLLAGLQTHGILRRDGGDKRWRLGYHLVIWGSVAAESTSLRDLAKPVMRDLVRATGETAILTVYHDHEVLCLDLCETPHPVRLRLAVGTRRPPHAGASSKVLMAYLPEEEIQAILDAEGLPRLCTHTITDPAELRAELARIRAQGYAESMEETDPGAWGVATPIRDWRGRVVAAIGIAAPTMRYSPEKARECVALCRRASEQISSAMGTGTSPQPT